MTRELVSAVVTTFNSAVMLDACLRGLGWADEIVVLDLGSTDATLAIAAQHGARIAQQPFTGYGAQKQSAIDLARYRWVLLLDSDEALPADAAAVLRHALSSPAHAGFELCHVSGSSGAGRRRAVGSITTSACLTASAHA